jgi:hypothetical protein
MTGRTVLREKVLFMPRKYMQGWMASSILCDAAATSVVTLPFETKGWRSQCELVFRLHYSHFGHALYGRGGTRPSQHTGNARYSTGRAGCHAGRVLPIGQNASSCADGDGG